MKIGDPEDWSAEQFYAFIFVLIFTATTTALALNFGYESKVGLLGIPVGFILWVFYTARKTKKNSTGEDENA